MSHKIIACRVDRCLGCRSCEMACAVEHSESKTLRGAVAESPRPQRRVTVERAGRGGLPLQCRHCEDAPCIAVCPTDAMHRAEEGGPVAIDADRCIGCRMCLLVCPFGVIALRRDGRAIVKCDQCIERTEAGRAPACVEACPTGALVFTTPEEYARLMRREAAEKVRSET
ncbi:MAG: 4Fe-4S dicluster domain-containing protein [Phycisphaerae bacterium]